MPFAELPAEINEFQWVELYEADGWDNLQRALRHGLEQHGVKYEPPAQAAEVRQTDFSYDTQKKTRIMKEVNL